MREIADDRHLIAEGLERLKNLRHFKAGARRFRLPLVDDGSVRDIDRTESRFRSGGCPERRLSRNHRLQKGQRHCDSGSSKECPAGKRLLCNEHLAPFFVGPVYLMFRPIGLTLRASSVRYIASRPPHSWAVPPRLNATARL